MSWIRREDVIDELQKLSDKYSGRLDEAGYWVQAGIVRLALLKAIRKVEEMPERSEADWVETDKDQYCRRVQCTSCGTSYLVGNNVSLKDWKEAHRYCIKCGAHMTGGGEMTLHDTVKGMESPDYKARFIAEYEQLVIRYYKLKRMLSKWDNGDLNFTPTCNRGLYNLQTRAMADYIATLESRAQIEGIELPEVEIE